MSERSTFPLAGSVSPIRPYAGGMGRMMLFIVATLSAGAAMARTIVVPPLAMPKYADTEVSTNIAFNADDAHLREFEMRFALEGDGVLGPFGGRAGVALPIRLEHDARHAQSPGVPAEWFSCAVSSHFFYNHAEVRPC